MGRGGVRTVRASLLGLLALAGTLTVTAAAAASDTARASSGTVWLCRPGQAPDPCATSRAATSVSGSGATSLQAAPASPRARRFDCFYVYPTVSQEKGLNADLTVQPAETAAAVVQASRFSQQCRVWAPMYRQVTVQGLTHETPAAASIAYRSLLAAWKDYLAHDNNGRPIVFIGHSQGAAVLSTLLQSQVDPSPTLRKRMVSAILLGGNVQVPLGQTVGGTFHHLPLCTSPSQTSCVIAYSSFGSPPPATSLFGRPGTGVSLQSGQRTAAGQQVACVNPVTFSSASGGLEPFFRTVGARSTGVRVRTPWVTFPGLYTAQCSQGGGATWLQVTATPAAGDPRSTVTASLGPNWGYHLVDVNLALGDLVADVGHEEASTR